MAKQYNVCVMCDSTKFLNHAGLCKRCNASRESVKIREKALEKEHAKEEFLKKQQALAAAEEVQEPAEEDAEKEEEKTS